MTCQILVRLITLIALLHMCVSEDVVPTEKMDCYACTAGTGDKDECTIIDENSKLTKQCNKDPGCYTKTDDKGQTVRGCIEDLTGEDKCEEKKCEKCSANKCNKGIFPTTRPYCFVCSGTDCQKADEKYKTLCRYMETDKDQCFTDVTDTSVIRGCLAHTDITCNDSKICTRELCNYKDKPCNNGEKILDLTCYQCRSDDPTQRNCGTKELDGIEKVKCKKKGTQCYVEFWENKFFRGCVSDLHEDDIADCKKRPKNCHICDNHNCNKDMVDSAVIRTFSPIILVVALCLTIKLA